MYTYVYIHIHICFTRTAIEVSLFELAVICPETNPIGFGKARQKRKRRASTRFHVLRRPPRVSEVYAGLPSRALLKLLLEMAYNVRAANGCWCGPSTWPELLEQQQVPGRSDRP